MVTEMPFVKIIDTIGSSLPIFKQKGKITNATIKDFDVKIEENKIAAYPCKVEMFLE